MRDVTGRRGFLRGLFGGVTSAGLIVAAKPDVIEAFAAPLVKDDPIVIDTPVPSPATIGEHLYNERGDLVAIVTEINVTIPKIDVTLFDSYEPTYVNGMPDVQIRAVGVGPLQLNGRDFPRLGRKR